MKIFINWILAAAAIAVTAYLIPGVRIDGIMPALVTAIVLGLINATLRPILLVLTLPINILTLGLFTLVINALLIMLTSSIVSGFYVPGFWKAMLFSVVLFFINTVIHAFNRHPNPHQTI